MIEEFRIIEGYEGYYEISNYGNVRSISRVIKRDNIGDLPLKERFLKFHLDKNGYYSCTLAKDNKKKTIHIHKLVAIVFLNHIPNGNKDVINHIDGNKTNNNLENLEIVTAKQNVTECFMPDKSTHKRVYSSDTKNILFRKDRNKWIVQVKIDNKRKQLGSFNTDDEAILKLKEYEAK